MAGAAGFVLWLWMVIDCKLFARRHKGTTEGTERAIWFDILILGILMGSMPGIVYWFMVKRPELLFGPQIVKEKPHRLRQRLTGDILVATAILLTIILIAALILRFKVFHLERMLQLSPEGFERVFRMMVLMGALGWLSIPLWGGIWLWLYLDCVKRQFPVTSEKIV